MYMENVISWVGERRRGTEERRGVEERGEERRGKERRGEEGTDHSAMEFNYTNMTKNEIWKKKKNIPCSYKDKDNEASP